MLFKIAFLLTLGTVSVAPPLYMQDSSCVPATHQPAYVKQLRKENIRKY